MTGRASGRNWAGRRWAPIGIAALGLALAAGASFLRSDEAVAQAGNQCRLAVIPLETHLDTETMVRIRDASIFVRTDCTASVSFTVAMEPGRNAREKFMFETPDRVGIFLSLTNQTNAPFVAAFEVGKVPALSCNSFQPFTFPLDPSRFDRATVVNISGGFFKLQKPEVMTPTPCS